MTNWSQFVAYICRHSSCGADCINHIDSAAAQTKQCWQCYHENEDVSLVSHHLPAEDPEPDAPALISE